MDIIAQAEAEQTRISSRKESLLAETAREVGLIDARLGELDVFLRVARGYAETKVVEPPIAHHNGHGLPDELQKRGGQKRLIEMAIKANVPHGITKSAISQWIMDKYGYAVASNYVGVALDRLKGDNLVRLEGNRWIAQSGTQESAAGTNEIPAAQGDQASST